MRASETVILASIVSLLCADVTTAQPRPPREGPPPPVEMHQPPGPPQYYYNGRWIDQSDWQNRGDERARWARNHERRHGRRDHHDSSSLAAGIIGFALGAAIVGSQQDVDKARRADRRWDDICARRYRSYDRFSRTYLGRDGLRHYCVP